MQGDAHLLEVVGTLGSPRRLARSLDGRQQKRDEHADDRDDDKQFDESKGATAHDLESSPWARA
jgi:hypothetical protein